MQMCANKAVLLSLCLVVTACSENEVSDAQDKNDLGNVAVYTAADIRALVNEGETDQAIQVLRARMDMQMATTQDFMLLAEAYIAQVNGAGALDAIERAQQKGATDQFVALPKAEALMMVGRFEEAEDLLDLVALVGPKGGRAALLIAQLSAEQGDMGKARRYFEYARDLAPTTIDSDIALSLVELADGNLDVASEIAESVAAGPAAAHRHEPFYVLGAIARIRRDPQQAIKYLQKALDAKPGDSLSQMELVGAYLDGQQTVQAQQALDSALARNPANPLGKFFVAYLKWQKGDAEDARDILKLENDLLVSYRPVKLLYANASYDAGEYEAAIPYFKQYLSEVPDDVSARLKLTDSLARAGRLEDAKQTVASTVAGSNLALTLSPDDRGNDPVDQTQTRVDILALAQAAAVDLSLNDVETARQKYLRAISYLESLDDKEEDLHRFLAISLARIEFGLDDRAKGIQSMQAALNIGQPTVNQIVTLANMQLAAGQFADVERLLKTLSDTAEVLPLKANLEGALAMRQGDHEAAISAFSEAISADPDYLSAIMNRASAYAGAQMFSEALADLKAIENRANSDGQYYAILGRAQQGLGNYGAALDAYENGLESLPESSFLNANYALMLIQQNRFEEALPAAQKALDVLPQDSPASVQLKSMIDDLRVAIDRASSRVSE